MSEDPLKEMIANEIRRQLIDTLSFNEIVETFTNVLYPLLKMFRDMLLPKEGEDK